MASENDRPCTQGGKRHRVHERELEEARAQDEGGTVICLDCSKPVEVGPTNLEFRGTVVP